MENNSSIKKRRYHKPKLEAEKVLEVHAVTCCRNAGAGCTNAGRDGAGKDNKNSTVS